MHLAAKPGSPKAGCALLDALTGWIGHETEVAVITDVGLRWAWFAADVERPGWGWIGRVRRGVHLGRTRQHGLWCFTSSACGFKRASSEAQREHGCHLTNKAE